LDPLTRFDFEVSNILREGKADLNEAFFAKVFGAIMDETEFRSRTEEFIKAGWDQEAEQLLRFRMMEKFFDEYPMDLPDAFLRRLIKDDKQGHDHDHHDHAGHEYDHADHDHSGHDHDHVAPGNPYESFAKQLRRDLVIDVLLKNHRVEITREDLLQEAEERLFRQFSSYGISPEQIPLRKYPRITCARNPTNHRCTTTSNTARPRIFCESKFKPYRQLWIIQPSKRNGTAFLLLSSRRVQAPNIEYSQQSFIKF
ncbi:MAG: hypothetical protein ACKO7V_13180, partial [Bacteroidota bacterium]